MLKDKTFSILCTSSNLYNVGEMVGVDFSRPIVGLKNADFESAHCFVSDNEVLINEKYDNEYDNYCSRQEPTEVNKERPPQQTVNRKRTMNSDFYDQRLETPDD
jgi:hypothetical protein